MFWFKIRSKVDVNTSKGDTIKNSTIINNDDTSFKEIVVITLKNINKSIELLDETIKNNTLAIQENHKMIIEHIDNKNIHK